MPQYLLLAHGNSLLQPHHAIYSLTAYCGFFFQRLLLSGDIELNPGPSSSTSIIKVRKKIKTTIKNYESSLTLMTEHSNFRNISAKAFGCDLISSDVNRSPTLQKIIHSFICKIEVEEDFTKLEKHCNNFIHCLNDDGPIEDICNKMEGDFKKIFKKTFCCNRRLLALICFINIVEIIIVLGVIAAIFAIFPQNSQEMVVHVPDREQFDLDMLNVEFTDLISKVKEAINDRAKKDENHLSMIITWVNDYTKWTTMPPEVSVNGIFKYTCSLYNFMDITFIKHINERFGNETSSFKQSIMNYIEKIDKLYMMISIDTLMNKQCQSFGNVQKVRFIMNQAWKDVMLYGFANMLRYVLPSTCHHHSVRQNILEVSEVSVLITYAVHDIPTQTLVEHANGTMEFIIDIGIFGFAVENNYILKREEDSSFSFQLALFQAAKKGHFESVEFLINSVDVDINYIYSNTSYTPQKTLNYDLLVESTYGHLFYKWLQSDFTYEPITVLMAASKQGHYKVVKFLLESNADPNIQSPLDGTTALMLASEEGHYQVVELLLNANADPRIFEADGWTPLMFACKNGHMTIIELLIQRESDYINHQEIDGWTALMLACDNGRNKVVQQLVKANVNTNIQDNDGRTALMIASENGNAKLVKYLKKYADTTITNHNNATALDLAVENERGNVVEILMKK